MTSFVALLRAINVGGTGKLAMADLKAMAIELGFERVSTFIASGNLLFHAVLDEAEVKQRLERRLQAHAGRPVGVMVRTAAEMAAVLAANPFPGEATNRTVAIFLDHAPPPDALEKVRHRSGEQISLGAREIYVHYGDGMGTSKLVIPAATEGTARNMNTVARLAALAGA